MRMRIFTFKAIVAAALVAVGCGLPTSAWAQKSHLQPLTGTMYNGSDSATQANPLYELEFDDHGNETSRISGTISSMTVDGHDYDYSKGYAVLLNEYEATVKNSGNDTIWFKRTWLNDKGVRTGMMVYSNTTYQNESGFTFDDAGHVTSLNIQNDTTALTWDGENLATYSHTISGWGKRVITIDSMEVAFNTKTFDAMQYNYDDLIDNFNTYHCFINGKGTYYYKSSYPKVDVNGVLTFQTNVKGNWKAAQQVVLLNDTDTLAIQNYTKLDDYGSYKLTVRQPLLYPDQITYSYVTYNEFGDLIQQIDSLGYLYDGEMLWEVSRDYTPVDYEGVKPLRKMDYYWSDSGNSWVLGTLTVYNDWDIKEPMAISDPVVVTRSFSEKVQPSIGTQYLGSDTSYSNGQAMYEYDDHGNEITSTTGSLSTFTVDAHSYDYSKGYPYLTEHSIYDLKNGEKSNEFVLFATTFNEDSIRTGISGYDENYQEITGYHFDSLGHVDSIKTASDTTILTWDGEALKEYYYHYNSSYAGRLYHLTDISVGYADRIFDAMESDYAALINDFTTYHTCINANGTYYYKGYGTEAIEGDLTIRTKVSDDSLDVYNVAIVNGLDTISEQKIHFDDAYGSYTLVKRSPALWGADLAYTYQYTYNEFGDLIKVVTTEPDAYSGNVYTTTSYHPTVYDGNKPVRYESYYEQGGEQVLGYVIVYDGWYTGIKNVTTENSAAGPARLYTVDGRLIGNLTAEEAAQGKFNVPQAGLYIIKQGNKARKVIIKQ